MTEEQKAWLHVYTTILATLAGNTTNLSRWEDMRQRAEVEANMACRKIGVSL